MLFTWYLAVGVFRALSPGPQRLNPLLSPTIPYNPIHVVVFTLNRSFYPTTPAVSPVSFLILHPRETQIMLSHSEAEKIEQQYYNEAVFFLQAKKPLHSGSYEHRVTKIKK